MDSGSLGKTSLSQEAAVFVQLLPCPELPSRSSSFVVISVHYFRFGVFGMKQIPSLVTVTSLFCNPQIFHSADAAFWECVNLGHCFQEEIFQRLVTDLWILLPFPVCSSREQPAGSSPACGDRRWVWGCSAEQRSLFCLLLLLLRGSRAASGPAHHSCCSPARGYLRTWSLHCIGSSAVRHRDDKQPDGSRSAPAQEYLPCKHAVTQARFACLICYSWERWICFSAVQGGV